MPGRTAREQRSVTAFVRILAVSQVIAASLVSLASASAGFDAGIAAYTRGDLKSAVRELLPAARANDSRAQYLIAEIYEKSPPESKARAAAIGWYRRAAANGVVAAMRRLGSIYRDGKGAESDPVQAYAWYDLASSRIGPHRDSFSRIRDDIAAKLPPLELAHAQLIARHWRGDAAKIGVMIALPPPPKRPAPEEMSGADASSAKAADVAKAARARVRRVQTALAGRGYDVGAIDGIMGPRTDAAIRAFQSDQGIEPDGRLTPGLIERLEGDAEEG